MGFSNVLDEAEIHAVSKIWEKWILIVREKYGKANISKLSVFLNFSYEAEIHAVPKIYEKWISLVR